MIEWLFLLSSLVVLMLSSDKAVNYVMKLSKVFGISEMSAGFILLSLSTSLPELVVAFNAALINQGNLAIGNVLGSNVANLTMILGLAVIISRRKKILFKRTVYDNLIEFLFISSFIPLFILQTGHVSLLLGLILVSLFVFFSVKTPTKVSRVEDITVMYKRDKIIVFIKFLAVISLVIVSSRLLVDSSVTIAESLSIPASVIGATMIALGTSLPELMTTVQAFRKRLFDVGLGSIIGSCITNLTLVLGLTSIFNHVALNIISFTSLILFSILSSMVTWYFISTGRRLDRRESLVLIGIYLIFVLQQLGFSIFIF